MVDGPVVTWVRARLRRPVSEDVSTDRDVSRRHRVLATVLAAHLPVLTGLGIAAGWSALHLLLAIGPIAALAIDSVAPGRTRRRRSLMTTLGLLGCSSVLVHATDGLPESYVHVFVVVALVARHEHWAPLLTCVSWVALHHVVAMVGPTAVDRVPASIDDPVRWALLHTIAVAAAAVAAFLPWRSAHDERWRQRLLLAATHDGVYLRDADGRIALANATLLALVGRADDVVGQQDHDVLGHPAPRDDCAVCDAVGGEGVEAHLVTLNVNGGLAAELTSASVRPEPDLHVVTIRDVTRRQHTERELRRLAWRDGLTGLANRTAMMQTLTAALRGARRRDGTVAVLMLDLDHFKDVNDSLGHAVGDELLVQVARRLTDLVRETDLVARLGGDEFVLLLEDTDPGAVMGVAQRVLDALAQPVVIGGATTRIGASIGVRIVEDEDVESGTVLRDADTALYASKEAGRNRSCVFDDDLGESTRRRVELLRELDRAIREDELVLHFQPMWDETTLELVAVEALVRWQHPERGLLGPGEFVTHAERTRMISALGSWVLDRAWRHMAAWQAHPGGLGVAVNVSRGQLQDRSLVDQVRSLAAEVPADPRRLWFEVTESTVVATNAATQRSIDELRAMGIKLAIDDFGTGHSSLATLHQLRVDSVKIDRAFVTDVDTDAVKAELLDAALHMAASLGLMVCTEGIETTAELDRVRLSGRGGRQDNLRLVQGFLLARPMPAAGIDALLAGRSRSAADQLAAPTSG